MDVRKGTENAADREAMAQAPVKLADLPDVMTVEEAARFLRLARSTAYDAVHRGEIPTFRVGRRIRVSKLALETMLKCSVSA